MDRAPFNVLYKVRPVLVRNPDRRQVLALFRQHLDALIEAFVVLVVNRDLFAIEVYGGRASRLGLGSHLQLFWIRCREIGSDNQWQTKNECGKSRASSRLRSHKTIPISLKCDKCTQSRHARGVALKRTRRTRIRQNRTARNESAVPVVVLRRTKFATLSLCPSFTAFIIEEDRFPISGLQAIPASRYSGELFERLPSFPSFWALWKA